MSDNNDFTHELVVYATDKNAGTMSAGDFIVWNNNDNYLDVENETRIKIGGGEDGQVLSTDGEGNLTWTDQGAGSTTGDLFLAAQQTNGSDFSHGYTFSGNEGGHDTGMYSPSDGILKLVSNTNTVVTVNPNKTITLAVLSAAPSSPANGTLAVADRTNWDPASKGSGGSYIVYYNGSTWNALF